MIEFLISVNETQAIGKLILVSKTKPQQSTIDKTLIVGVKERKPSQCKESAKSTPMQLHNYNYNAITFPPWQL